MLVVDTNLIVYHYLSDEHAPILAAVLRHDRWWIAPRLWQSELQNVLWTYVRRDLLQFEDAIAILDNAGRLVGTIEPEASAEEILRLAVNSGCSAYDCEFVALAQKLNIPLLTFDRLLLRSFPTTALTPAAYLSG